MPRNSEIKLKLNKDEKEKLQKKADALGLKLSVYIRLVSVHANINVK